MFHSAPDSFDLINGAFPDKQLVYTNLVYVNPDEKACFVAPLSGKNYLLCNDLAVFCVQYVCVRLVVCVVVLLFCVLVC